MCVASLRQQAHHRLAIDEIFGAAEADKTYFGRSLRLRDRGYAFLYGHWDKTMTVLIVNISREQAFNSSIPPASPAPAGRAESEDPGRYYVFCRSGRPVLINTSLKTPEKRYRLSAWQFFWFKYQCWRPAFGRRKMKFPSQRGDFLSARRRCRVAAIRSTSGTRRALPAITVGFSLPIGFLEYARSCRLRFSEGGSELLSWRNSPRHRRGICNCLGAGEYFFGRLGYSMGARWRRRWPLP